MSYINLNILEAKQLTLTELSILQLCKQAKMEDVSAILSSHNSIVDLLIRKNLLEEIKGKKTDTFFQKIRTTKLGNETLENIETPEIIEDDLRIFEWLKNIYLESNKELGNQKKTKLLIALFRVNSGISKNSLAYLCQSFINDESQFEWSKKLEFLFFKPANMYEKFNIDGSKLYQYYLKNQVEFDKKFETL